MWKRRVIVTETAKRMIRNRIRRREASDERQYMINDSFEIYEKQGAPLGAMTFHYHSFYEIIYVLEGEYASMLDNRTYSMKKGDFLLIDRNVMHKYQYVENRHDSSRRIILWISPGLLAQLGGKDLDLSVCFQEQESCVYHFPIYYEEMLQGYLLKLAMTESADPALPGARQVLDRGYLTLFFGYLNILCNSREYLFNREEPVRHPLVEQVSDYIDGHLTESLSVELLAAQIHMSKYYFLRKFKEITGVTVHSFVISKRLIRACELLRQGKSVLEACRMTGFQDYSSFLRNFREAFGVPPGKYREFYPID